MRGGGRGHSKGHDKQENRHLAAERLLLRSGPPLPELSAVIEINRDLAARRLGLLRRAQRGLGRLGRQRGGDTAQVQPGLWSELNSRDVLKDQQQGSLCTAPLKMASQS